MKDLTVLKYPDLGAALRSARFERKLSIEELSKLSGVSTRIIDAIENGDTRWPAMKTRARLHKALSAIEHAFWDRQPLGVARVEDIIKELNKRGYQVTLTR